MHILFLFQIEIKIPSVKLSELKFSFYGRDIECFQFFVILNAEISHRGMCIDAGSDLFIQLMEFLFDENFLFFLFLLFSIASKYNITTVYRMSSTCTYFLTIELRLHHFFQFSLNKNIEPFQICRLVQYLINKVFFERN